MPVVVICLGTLGADTASSDVGVPVTEVRELEVVDGVSVNAPDVEEEEAAAAVAAAVIADLLRDGIEPLE